MKNVFLILLGMFIGVLVTVGLLKPNNEHFDEVISAHDSQIGFTQASIDFDDKRKRSNPFNTISPMKLTPTDLSSVKEDILHNELCKEALKESQSVVSQSPINQDRLKEYIFELGLFSKEDLVSQDNLENYLIQHYFDYSQSTADRLDSLNYASLSNKSLIDEAIVQNLLDDTNLMDESEQSDEIVKSLSIINGVLEQQSIFQVEKYLDFDDPDIRQVAIQAISNADDNLQFRDKLLSIWKSDNNSAIRNDVYFILVDQYGFEKEYFDTP